jgi:LCP family protein required for cell wall assembly
MARKARKRTKSPLWARMLVGFGIVLVMASGGSLAGGKLLLDHYSSQVTHTGGLGTAAAAGKSIDGPINLLLVGIDERPADTANGARSDSIIIAHIPATHDSVYLTSIPRDTRVQIPAYAPTKYRGGTAKINSAFDAGYENGGGRDGGLTLLAETVSNLAGGLKFNGAAIVNFDGFASLVDAIGGVPMCVDEKVTSVHVGVNTRTGKEGIPYNFANDLPTTLKPNMKPQVYNVGCYNFAAWQALDYVRQRDKLANNDGDYGRQRHQQQFIKAMLSKASSAGIIANPLRVNAILNSIGKAVSFYNNGISLADWIFTLKGISPNAMTTIKVNNGKFNTQIIDGQSYEILDDRSKALLTAIGQDQVGEYLTEHPDMVGNDASQPAASPSPSTR